MNRSPARVCSVIGIAAAAALLGAVSPVAASAADASDGLFSTPQSAGGSAPFTLDDGGSLPSPAQGFYLLMQSDGNLVEYLTSAQRAVWSSRTTCSTTSHFVFQTDGNAVVYCGDTATFSTATARSSGDPGSFLLSDDGLLEVSGPEQWDNGVHVPDGVLGTLTSGGAGRYGFVMQTDGNLVLYSHGSGTRALWSSGTAGNPGSVAIAQTDGNLVVYNAAGRAIWASQTFLTAVYGTYFVRAQEDGNVVIYQQDTHTGPIRVAWQTGTAGRS